MSQRKVQRILAVSSNVENSDYKDNLSNAAL